MKRLSRISVLCILITILFTLSACNSPFSTNKKNSNNYYFSKLATSITLCKTHKITLLDTNFYKTKELKSEDIRTLLNFMNSLNKTNFVSEPLRLPKEPEYKIFLKLDKDNFVINVYNEHYASIFPWDGTSPMDFIDMSSLHKGYNLYNLCKYLIPNDID